MIEQSLNFLSEKGKGSCLIIASQQLRVTLALGSEFDLVINRTRVGSGAVE